MKLQTTVVQTLQPWFPQLDLSSVHVVHSGPVCWYVRSVIKQGAMTIAPYVFYGRSRLEPDEDSSIALLAHELKHVEQYREMGHVRFLATYLGDMAKAKFHYSHELPLEAPAYALQDEVSAALRARRPVDR